MERPPHLSFDSVGGLQEHIEVLKEMIIYPLLYKDLFESYDIKPPRGVLFYGPPGTGKTLMAGAIAAECSNLSRRPVAFYMQTGGECLSKYVGESERHLRDLFKEAHRTRPSIIFFDELDGLVPARSEVQEQIHTSIVTTLLALMDGLDAKSEIFVIGATNRIDMIDPALRRPGRFDKELYFPLPPIEARVEILKIHTRNWRERPNEEFLLKLAAECSGYCGADIQSLCSQAVMGSFTRNFPEVSDISKRQSVTLKNIKVMDTDFWEAKGKIIPAFQRISQSQSSPLRLELQPLLKKNLDDIINEISKSCPFCFLYRNEMDASISKSLSCPRFLLIGKVGQAHVSHLAPAVLHYFDHLPVTIMDLTTVKEENSNSALSNSFVQKFQEARQNMPSIIYFKNLASWWNLIHEKAKHVLISSVEALDASSDSKIFIFTTASVPSYDYLPNEIKQLFPKKKCFVVKDPTTEEKKNFFKQVIIDKNLQPPKFDKCSTPSQGESGICLRKFTNGPNGVGLSKLRNGKVFRRPFEDFGAPSSKRVKISFIPNCSEDIDHFTGSEIKVDIRKLEKLTESAVKATSKASISSMIRLNWSEKFQFSLHLKLPPVRQTKKVSNLRNWDEMEKESYFDG